MDKMDTKNDLIVLPIGKILIVRKNGRKDFFKVNEDNTVIDLNEEERKYIDNIFNLPRNSIINYETAWDVAKNNKHFQDNPLLWEKVISAVDGIIPKSAKDNFKRNLQTLETEIIEEEKQHENSGHIKGGSYDIEDNKIRIPKEYIDYLEELQEQGLIENGNRDFLHAVIHELIHSASSEYDKENGILRTGLDKYKKDEPLNSSNRGLTEGITENMTKVVMNNMFGRDIDSLEGSGYKKEALIARQLQMLCPDELMEQYFKGNGIQEIKGNLKDYYKGDTDWDNEVENLFDRIEDGFLLRKCENEEGFKSRIPATVQHTLLSALDKKIEKDIERGTLKSAENVEEYMGIYGKSLLTPENLELQESEKKKFPGLQIASKRFEDIKNRNKQRFILREQQEQENKKYLEEIESQNEGKVQDIPKDEATTEIEELNNTENQRQENTVIENNITPQQIEQATENVTISSINNETSIAENVIEALVVDAPVIE